MKYKNIKALIPIELKAELIKNIEIYNTKVLPNKITEYKNENPFKKNPYSKLKFETAAFIVSYMIYKFYYKFNTSNSEYVEIPRTELNQFHFDPKQYIDFICDRNIFNKISPFFNPKTKKRDSESKFRLDQKYYDSKYITVKITDYTTLKRYNKFNQPKDGPVIKKLKKHYNRNLNINYPEARNLLNDLSFGFPNAKQNYMIEQIRSNVYYFQSYGAYDCLKFPIYYLKAQFLELLTYKGSNIVVKNQPSVLLEIATSIMYSITENDSKYLKEIKKALTIGNKSYYDELLTFIKENECNYTELERLTHFNNELIDDQLLNNYKHKLGKKRLGNRIKTIDNLKNYANMYLFSPRVSSKEDFKFISNYLNPVKTILLSIFGNERVIWRVIKNISNYNYLDGKNLGKPIYVNKEYILKA
jgi:hypothetical protein